MAQHHEVPETKRPYRPVRTGGAILPPGPPMPQPARRVRSRDDLCGACYAADRCLHDRLCWDVERHAIRSERGG